MRQRPEWKQQNRSERTQGIGMKVRPWGDSLVGWSKVWDGASLTACSSGLGGEEVLRDKELLVT